MQPKRFFFEKDSHCPASPSPAPEEGWGGVGAVPRRKAGKHFFFEKKQQKTFDYFGVGLPGEAEAEFAKVFWFFFQKRTASAACLGSALDNPAYLGSYKGYNCARECRG